MATPLKVKKHLLKEYVGGKPIEELLEYHNTYCRPITLASLRCKLSRWRHTTPKEPRRIVGVIGDTHFPFNHPDYLPFLIKTFKKWGVTDVVHIGDAVDNHVISRHDTEPDATSAKTEYNRAMEEFHKYTTAFPNMTITVGSHDMIPHRQAKKMGLYTGFIKTYEEAWKLPDTVKVVKEVIINGVKYHHGTRIGVNAARQTAQDNMMSTVQGHSHSGMAVVYQSTAQKRMFGMVTGVGIDYDEQLAYAFRYNLALPKKPLLGCGIVISDTEAYTIPFQPDK